MHGKVFLHDYHTENVKHRIWMLRCMLGLAKLMDTMS